MASRSGFPCLRAHGPWLHLPMMLRQPSEPLTQRNLGSNALLNHGQWTHEPDVRDSLPTATGLFPFIVHEAHCLQAKQKDKHAWKTAHDANQAAS